MKNLQKNRTKILTVLSMLGMVLFLSGSIYAVVQLAVVPQKIGFKDVEFKELKRPYCEECHGASVSDKHHKTKNAVSGNCVFCHDVKTADAVGVVLKTDCMECHKKSPHHETKAALSKDCTSCHDSPGVSKYSTDVPKYSYSIVTPTKDTCKKCHRDGEVNGEKVFDIKKTHHGISFKDCNVCHGTNKADQDIRICERCHSVKAIHEVKPHVEKSACVHCHDAKEGASYKKDKK